jgi:uncharacterized membrane protein YgcG
VDDRSRAHFVTTKPLAPEEGLTIVVSFPKRFVAEPTDEEKFQYFLDDNRAVLGGLAGLLVLWVYYLAVWLWVGKDPERGIIMPLYEPPPDLSPAAARYLAEMGYDDRVFAAAIIHMAVKKYLTISEKDGVYTLKRIRKDQYGLTPDEKAIAGKLFGDFDQIELKNTNHARMRSAIDALKTRLSLNLEKTHFMTNRKYLIPGLVFSVVALIAVCIMQPGEQKFVAVFMTVWLSGWSVGVFFLGSQVIKAWKDVITPGGSVVAEAGAAIFITLFSLPFFGGEIAGIVVLTIATSLAVMLILLAMAATNFAFHHFLKAPTRLGRDLLDRVEGFKMFLSAVEKDRMNLLNPPDRTPQLFERFLPYALALGVEQQWSEQFADVLAEAGVPGETYSPAWYSGSGWRNLGASGFASSLSSSFSSAISSSSHAPGSRSGGGGRGSSGGGGGGGGGGGW